MTNVFWSIESTFSDEYRKISTLKLYYQIVEHSTRKTMKYAVLLTLQFAEVDYSNHPKYTTHKYNYTTIDFDGIQNMQRIRSSKCENIEDAKLLAQQEVKDYALGLLSGIDHFFIPEISITEFGKNV